MNSLEMQLVIITTKALYLDQIRSCFKVLRSPGLQVRQLGLEAALLEGLQAASGTEGVPSNLSIYARSLTPLHLRRRTSCHVWVLRFVGLQEIHNLRSP